MREGNCAAERGADILQVGGHALPRGRRGPHHHQTGPKASLSESALIGTFEHMIKRDPERH